MLNYLSTGTPVYALHTESKDFAVINFSRDEHRF
jgi:hypothetical protein